MITPAAGAFGASAVVAALALNARVIAMGRDLETLQKVKDLDPERIRIVQNTGDVDRDVQELTKDGPLDAFFGESVSFSILNIRVISSLLYTTLDISPGKAIKSSHWASCIKALRRGGRVSFMGAFAELTLPTLKIVLDGKWR